MRKNSKKPRGARQAEHTDNTEDLSLWRSDALFALDRLVSLLDDIAELLDDLVRNAKRNTAPAPGRKRGRR